MLRQCLPCIESVAHDQCKQGTLLEPECYRGPIDGMHKRCSHHVLVIEIRTYRGAKG